MSDQPPLPLEIWGTLSVEAQSAVLASFEERIAALEKRLGKDSSNSSKPPSSDPPSARVKRRPREPVSGWKWGVLLFSTDGVCEIKVIESWLVGPPKGNAGPGNQGDFLKFH